MCFDIAEFVGSYHEWFNPSWVFFQRGVSHCELGFMLLEWMDSAKTQEQFERLFFPPWIPSGWFVHKGNFCKWGNPSGISTAPIPNNTVGSSHCGMLGSLWLVYRVYRILCCLWNVVVGNLLCKQLKYNLHLRGKLSSTDVIYLLYFC